MNNAIFSFGRPQNEPIQQYLKGSPERAALEQELKKMSSEEIEIPLIIGGKEIKTGNIATVVMPHNHKKVLARYHQAGEKEIEMAIEAALEAKKKWEDMPWIERATITLKAAELLAKKYRYVINAATMLGQSKNIFQAEIDSACEAIDFLRYNAHFASEVYKDQPGTFPGQINKMEYRPLEGFVFSLSPFNFTAIASNLNMIPVLMGNVTLWKPSSTAILSNYYMMKVFKEAGLPDGVINFVPGKGSVLGKVITNHRALAGIHFTGSTATFNTLWKNVAENMEKYIGYPKLVGETGGKDFVFAHNSACPSALATALVAGAFEYQGQKCSAASRAYIPKSIWGDVKKIMLEHIAKIKIGDVQDFDNFMNAVIDEASFDNIMSYINYAKDSKEAEIITGGNGDKSVGYFIEPTIILTTNPHFKSMQEEIFGPVLTVYVYDDNKFEETMEICNTTSPYGLTGAIFCNDKYITLEMFNKLRYAAGNFYINDKPTGAMVGLQPFGGGRASGTNDKAGSYLNLIRWTNPRAIKENFLSPTEIIYPYMK
ncbi:MAG: L-glutamate gamma-semialdehyde dehydrogenase [Bacteroidales bacterium]|jgi:1-pyrroline-5-carboxylate dehydrogenase|nr:L-glutamate gamma-semialdehyde dehydrogenase [Bacteroidales bacterium]